MEKYFLICASRDHVRGGVEGGFAQAGHGRKDFMSKPAKGDMLVFYSAKTDFENGETLQAFTALGTIIDEEPYQPDNNPRFKPYRRDVKFEKVHEAPIRPLIDSLSFIKNKKRWGFSLITGFREISKEDFDLIKKAMRIR